MKSRTPESGFEQYLRRVRKAVRGTRAEKNAETERVRSALCEIPHAETMSYEILCAAAGTPESFAANEGKSKCRPWRPLVLSAVILFLISAVFLLGAALHRGEKMPHADGYVESYRYEDGSLRTFLEENPQLLR